MKGKRNTLTVFFQRLYITGTAFTQNDLITYATAGAYGFLLSALPILLMVIIILIRVVHASPAIITGLISQNAGFAHILDPESILDSALSIKAVGIVEIILVFSIFWMARSFFTSIQKGMTTIYRNRGKGKAIKDNLLVIAAEVILITLVVVMVAFMMSGKAIFSALAQAQIIAPAIQPYLRAFLRIVPFGLVIAFLFFIYYTVPRIKPRPRQSLFASLGCALTFALAKIALDAIVNMTKYNLVYGILSNVIVLLLEVYVFFLLFLFFAQYQYVSQYFEGFLLSKLYLLPEHDDPSPVKQFERMLFIEPPYFREKFETRARAGETLFARGDASTELYYVWEGAVRLAMPGHVIDVGKGSMFGEFSVIIGGNRTATATALTDCVLLKIPDHIFQETIEIDGNMSRRTLQMIADHMRKK